jgi:hypothetical protein
MEYAASGSQPFGVEAGWFQAQASGGPADLQSVGEQRVVVPLLTVLA